MRRNNWLSFALFIAAAGCSRASEASIEKTDSRSVTAATMKSGSMVAGDPQDTDAYGASMSGTGDCKVNEECKVVLRLKAKGDFHINKEYPTKFNPAASEGVEYVGAPYRFTPSQEKEETFTITIKRTSAGAISPKGQFKFGVCTSSGCQMASVDLSATIS